MPKPIKPNDLIALRDDLRQHNLSRGRIGRVIQVFTPNEFEATFFALGEKIRLKTEQVVSLYDDSTLNEEGFWKMIEDAKADSGGEIQRQYELLVDRLSEMSVADIFAFGDIQ